MTPTKPDVIPRQRHRLTTLAKYLLAAWLLGSLLFAHGCHGNEDNELFTACVAWIGK